MWVSCYIFVTFLLFQVSCQDSDSENATTTTLPSSTTTSDTIVSSSTSKPENISCEVHNGDCNACVAFTWCYYCETNKKCNQYGKIINPSECEAKKIHYLTCKLNFQVMIIGLSVAAGVVLLIIIIACCCCCCKRKGIKISKDELKWARQRDERKQIAEDRRKERAERTEQIRKKYGLVKDSNPYQKFDD